MTPFEAEEYVTRYDNRYASLESMTAQIMKLFEMNRVLGQQVSERCWKVAERYRKVITESAGRQIFFLVSVNGNIRGGKTQDGQKEFCLKNLFWNVISFRF